ncbi:hypothetical protein Runsl_5318 [Runella slithyformis DSM 19594]|uniref:Uncharacterized protein n=1 Tax=Runella slithyformis (strain ATCC 29530 / DSM 19594 / LMG 11500 / NCIMB 11436 / LSU 4) TaxID=761193 RepID=A0A7U4E8T5_RUNSL|nr:hypothetical protein Runsl_5318 [Runella slithyformis DSM 19594]
MIQPGSAGSLRSEESEATSQIVNLEYCTVILPRSHYRRPSFNTDSSLPASHSLNFPPLTPCSSHFLFQQKVILHFGAEHKYVFSEALKSHLFIKANGFGIMLPDTQPNRFCS